VLSEAETVLFRPRELAPALAPPLPAHEIHVILGIQRPPSMMSRVLVAIERLAFAVAFALAASGIAVAAPGDEFFRPRFAFPARSTLAFARIDTPTFDGLSLDVAREPEDEDSRGADSFRAPRFRDFPRALGYNFTRGLFSRENLTPLLIGTGATLAVLPFDEEMSARAYGSWEGLGDAGHAVGGTATAVLNGGLLLAAPFVRNEKYRAFSFTLAQTLIVNNSILFALKLSVRRERPDHEDEHSFPSGHMSNNVAMATLFQHYYGSRLGIPMYIVAAVVGVSRVETGKHYASDVVFGAALGYIAAKTTIRGTERYSSGRAWTLAPTLGVRHAGLLFLYQF
jgi:membrane-associated phospholipid phosphatase